MMYANKYVAAPDADGLIHPLYTDQIIHEHCQRQQFMGFRFHRYDMRVPTYNRL